MTAPPTSTDDDWRAAAAAVLAHYALDIAAIERLPHGLINLTLLVVTGGGQRYVLQRLHTIFTTSVNHNLDHVSRHLAARGLATPLLVRARDDALDVTHHGRLWRMLTYVRGRTLSSVESTAQAHSAAALLARFHRALVDFPTRLTSARAPVHDFERHMARLMAARATHASHRLYDAVAVASEELLSLRARHRLPMTGAERLVHGDPKISNILFSPHGPEAHCLIDLDTLAYMPLPFELGDALRSWCNPRGEDAQDAYFDLALFKAAIDGYATAAPRLSADEMDAIVPATFLIHLELAARFLCDALEETYFGWDAGRYDSRGHHNLARARGQLRAARSLEASFDAALAHVAATCRRL